MTFFVLIPFYWFASTMLYAASPRQQINNQYNKALIRSSVAWVSFITINIASYFWLITVNNSMATSIVMLLLINMLMVPTSIMLLAHKPHWLKINTFMLFSVSLVTQNLVHV